MGSKKKHTHCMFFSTQFLPPPASGLHKAAIEEVVFFEGKKKHPQWGKTGGTVWNFFAETKKKKHESKRNNINAWREDSQFPLKIGQRFTKPEIFTKA